MHSLQLEVLKLIQSISSPFLDTLFSLITRLGEEAINIFAFSFIYWCYDKKSGKQLILTFTMGCCTNSLLKVMFNISRPIGEEGIRTLNKHSVESCAFPSGHTQATATFFYFLIYNIKKYWFTILAWLAIILVGFSRLYLGKHWPTDVIGAIIISVVIVRFGISIIKVILTLFLVNSLLLFISTDGFVNTTALFTASLLGIFIEEKLVKYKVEEGLLNNTIKLAIGIIIVFGSKIGLFILFPTTQFFNYIRYFLIGI